METVRHWINNEPVSAEGARTGEVFNPATGEVARRVVYSTVADVDAAVARPAAQAGLRAGCLLYTSDAADE